MLHPDRTRSHVMLKLTRWCIKNRRVVFVAWVVVAVLTTALAQVVGRNYATNFTLPGTESQHVVDLLTREFPAQGGDVDTLVFHPTSGTVDARSVRSVIEPALARIARFPHVVGVISPYGQRGAFEISRDRRTAFATINFDKRANLLPNNTGAPLIALVKSLQRPDLKVAAGGQVVEQAEGFNIGPATAVGVIAALIILLFTFGSLVAAGMPLITAGIGLVTGVALIGLATHVTSVPMVSTDLALMIGLGVGIDYALFIVTRFRENYAATGDVERSVLEAMDTSGRSVLLAGTTVMIALLGMFATGVTFMYGLAIASVLAVLMTMAASLTLLPAMLSRVGPRVARRHLGSTRRFRRRRAEPAAVAAGAGGSLGNGATGNGAKGNVAAEGESGDGTTGNGAPMVSGSAGSRWRRWSEMVQARPWPLAIMSAALMVVLMLPVFSLRLETSDAGNDPSNQTSRQAFDMLAAGFGAGFNGPLLLVAELPSHGDTAALPKARAALAALAKTPDVAAVTQPRLSPSGRVAVLEIYPHSAPQAPATTDLVNRLRHEVLPPIAHATNTRLLVGGFTAGSIDFSRVLAGKLPLFIAIVVLLSGALLLVMFRSIVIALQAAIMNLLSIGAALGVTVAVFQLGWGGSLFGLEKGPIEPWIPVLMFAVVFGLSMDYEVFLVSRVREEWVRNGDASAAVADGIAFTGRVISAAAAIMVCVFLSFMLGSERTIKEFGFGLAVAVFLDALVVRCVLLPSVLEILGPTTWRLPRWLDARLPHINIEGSAARAAARTGAAPIEAGALEPSGV
jgi:RND superfamily putative drug exporter